MKPDLRRELLWDYMQGDLTLSELQGIMKALDEKDEEG